MLTLAAAETVAGVAGAFSITCTLFGMELAAGVETYKRLSQGVLSNAGAAVVYTTPASTQTFVKSIHLANTSAVAVTGISLYTKGLLAANRLMGSITIPANGWAICGEDGWRIYDQNGALQVGLVVGLAYKFNTATTGDPGSGHFGFDNATFTSAAVMRINKTSADGFNVGLHLSAMLNAIPKCAVVFKSTDGSKIFDAIALGSTFFVDNSTYYSIQITPQFGSSGVVNDQAFSAEFYLYGVDGRGVPTGGSNGQYLKKNSGTDFDTSWVNFPARQPILTAAADYYVRGADGSDSNAGLVNTSGGAFKTIQKAINIVGGLDLSIYGANIHVADATYIEALLVNGPWVGSGTVNLIGNTTTPANVHVNTSSLGSAFQPMVVQNGGSITVSGIKLTNTAAVFTASLLAAGAGAIHFDRMDFGVGYRHMSAVNGGSIFASHSGSYTISGAGNVHWWALLGGSLVVEATTLVLTGTPAFALAFAGSTAGGSMVVDSNVYTGSATGKRYDVQGNGAVGVFSGNVNELPGNAAGTTATGGQYF